jgi:hypothetical protein
VERPLCLFCVCCLLSLLYMLFIGIHVSSVCAESITEKRPCPQKRARTHARIRTHAHAHAHIRTYTHTHIYTYTQTHIHTYARARMGMLGICNVRARGYAPAADGARRRRRIRRRRVLGICSVRARGCALARVPVEEISGAIWLLKSLQLRRAPAISSHPAQERSGDFRSDNAIWRDRARA